MNYGKALIDHARKQAQIVVNNLDSLDGLWALQACPEPSVHDGDILDLSDPASVERLDQWLLLRDSRVERQVEIRAALAAAYQRGKNEALNGPRIGVRLRDAFWIDSRHYDHYHDYGDTVTHEVGEWCPHQLIGQNYPCPPSHDETAESAILDAQADR